MTSRLSAGIFLFLSAAISGVEAREIRSMEEALRLGDMARMNGLPEKSQEYYLRASELKPKEATPVLGMAFNSYELMKYADAKQLFMKAKSLKKDKPTQKSLDFLLAKMNEAGSILDAIEKASALGDEAAVGGLHSEAAQAMSRAPVSMALLGPHLRYLSAKEPGNLDVLSALADGYYLSGESAYAYIYYKKLISQTAPPFALYERYADVAVNIGAFDEARRSYKQALRQAMLADDKPSAKKILETLKKLPRFSDKIEELVEHKSYSDAFKELRKVLSRNVSHPWALLQMARLYQDMGRVGQAERLYLQAVEWRPEDPAARYAMAQFYLYQKKAFEKALEEFKLARTLLNENVPLTPDEAVKKNLKKSIRDSTRAIYYIYMEILKRPRSAVAEMEWLKKTGQAEAMDYLNLGVAYARVKKRTSAFQALKKVVEMDPKSEMAKDAEALIESIRSDSKKGFQVGPDA